MLSVRHYCHYKVFSLLLSLESYSSLPVSLSCSICFRNYAGISLEMAKAILVIGDRFVVFRAKFALLWGKKVVSILPS